MNYSYAEFVPVFKALSDETRLKIVDMLSCGEKCACKLLEAFKITQPTLSYHMKTLTDSGLVVGVRNGAWMNYSINQERLAEAMAFLKQISEDTADCICKQEGETGCGQ